MNEYQACYWPPQTLALERYLPFSQGRVSWGILPGSGTVQQYYMRVRGTVSCPWIRFDLRVLFDPQQWIYCVKGRFNRAVNVTVLPCWTDPWHHWSAEPSTLEALQSFRLNFWDVLSGLEAMGSLREKRLLTLWARAFSVEGPLANLPSEQMRQLETVFKNMF